MRRIVPARAGGRCEICRAGQIEMAHRIDRSDGGPWSPGNILALCRTCHAWTHQHATWAGDGGWRLASTSDYLDEPAFVFTDIGMRWVLLNDTGEYIAHDMVPVLPPGVTYAQ